MRIYTIGFTKKSAERFFGLLRDSGAKRVVDVRLHNVSQLAGFAKRDDLAYFLGQLCGMEYVHIPSLAPTKDVLAEYKNGRMSWDEYEARFTDLMAARRIEEKLDRDVIEDGCLLCSEDKPHHCHRRLVAEYLREHWGTGVEIAHLGWEDRMALPLWANPRPGNRDREEGRP